MQANSGKDKICSEQANKDAATHDLLMGTNVEEEERRNDAAEVETEDEVGSDDEATVSKNKDYIFPTPEEVDKCAEPCVGMTFGSLSEAQRYLKVHGVLHGYPIRKGTNYLKKTYHLECNKSGKSRVIENAQKDSEEELYYENRLQDEVIIKLINRQWVFTKVNAKHNHSVVSSPSLTKFFFESQKNDRG